MFCTLICGHAVDKSTERFSILVTLSLVYLIESYRHFTDWVIRPEKTALDHHQPGLDQYGFLKADTSVFVWKLLEDCVRWHCLWIWPFACQKHFGTEKCMLPAEHSSSMWKKPLKQLFDQHGRLKHINEILLATPHLLGNLGCLAKAIIERKCE